jgi:hypothetical protein
VFFVRLAAEESFVVLPGTLWWHFALRRLPDHAAAYCEAPPVGFGGDSPAATNSCATNIAGITPKDVPICGAASGENGP